MPIYEYECTKCGKITEIIQKFSDSPLQDCPQCGRGVDRLISRSAFHLKGTGWYETDFKAKPSQSSGDSKKPEAKKADSSGKVAGSGASKD